MLTVKQETCQDETRKYGFATRGDTIRYFTTSGSHLMRSGIRAVYLFTMHTCSLEDTHSIVLMINKSDFRRGASSLSGTKTP